MTFPMQYQPRQDVGAICVTSQEELDALIASGWPDAAFTPEVKEEKKPKRDKPAAE